MHACRSTLEDPTEISTKFQRARLERELAAAGFEPAGWWTDRAGDFALSLWQVR